MSVSRASPFFVPPLSGAWGTQTAWLFSCECLDVKGTPLGSATPETMPKEHAVLRPKLQDEDLDLEVIQKKCGFGGPRRGVVCIAFGRGELFGQEGEEY